jgi:hypothetical protein
MNEPSWIVCAIEAKNFRRADPAIEATVTFPPAKMPLFPKSDHCGGPYSEKIARLRE